MLCHHKQGLIGVVAVVRSVGGQAGVLTQRFRRHPATWYRRTLPFRIGLVGLE